jgi:hypothetical protein
MRRSTGWPLAGLITVLLTIALAGFLLGNHRASASAGARADTPRLAAGPGILLEYPPTWRPVHGAEAIPGLAISDALVLAPNGEQAEASLLSGRLSAGEPGPLPAAFTSLLRGLPHTEVVALDNVQAYRYSDVRLQGYGRALELYVIPNAVEGSTVLACSAAGESSAFLAQCEQIVTQLALPGQSLYALSPDAPYATALARLIEALDRQRLALRDDLHAHPAPAKVAPLATALAELFANTASSVRTLESPQAAGWAQAALVSSMLSAQSAYRALAGAASAGSASAEQTAEESVSKGEREVDDALEDYALLGYGRV